MQNFSSLQRRPLQSHDPLPQNQQCNVVLRGNSAKLVFNGAKYKIRNGTSCRGQRHKNDDGETRKPLVNDVERCKHKQDSDDCDDDCVMVSSFDDILREERKEDVRERPLLIEQQEKEG